MLIFGDINIKIILLRVNYLYKVCFPTKHEIYLVISFQANKGKVILLSKNLENKV